MQKITYKMAEPSDAQLVVDFMHKLGDFQQMSAAIIITEEKMKTLLNEKTGEAIFAYDNGNPIAFAYFCQHSSAFIGEKALYIDAFYVNEEYRKHGIGKNIMAKLAQICLERKYARMEWGCLDWNKNAWDFYVKLGSVPFEILTLHRLSGENLINLAKE